MSFEFCRCFLKAFRWIREVFSVGLREIVRVKLRGEVTGEEFDDSVILFLLEGGMEHLSVFRQVVGIVLGATGVVSVSYFGYFTGDEFLSGGCCEIAIIRGAIWDGGNVSVDGFRVFVSAIGALDGFFPGECVRPDVG